MNADFARTLALLRQEKDVSQRAAAKELGISQALLSHYENGIREPGLAFVVRACNYYHVSADYLLGRTLSRDGSMIEPEALYDSSDEKSTLRGSIAATLQKKLLVNATNLLFELLGALGSREAVDAAGAYLSGALYRLYRMLHRAGSGNDSYFSLEPDAFSSGAVEAQMQLDAVAYSRALRSVREVGVDFPAMDNQALAQSYPALSQSLTQVLHTTEARTNALLS